MFFLRQSVNFITHKRGSPPHPLRLPTPSPTRAPTSKLPSLNSQRSRALNSKDGLARVAGNRKLYLKLLRQFIDQQGAAPAQIVDALKRNDISSAERLAHTVKGVAATLGADPVSQVAGRLEKAINTKSSAEDLVPLLREFESITDDFITGSGPHCHPSKRSSRFPLRSLSSNLRKRSRLFRR